jgi:hypothetical protein
MRLTVVPPIDEATEEVFREALRRVGLEQSSVVPAGAAWWRAGIDAAVERGSPDDDYARSPRSTRGATRA